MQKERKRVKLNKSLSYKGQQIEYCLTLKDQKFIRLKLEDTSINVSAPFHAYDWEIEQLIYKNIQKIQKIIDYREKNQFFLISENGFVKMNDQKYAARFLEKIDRKEKLDFKLYETKEETVKRMYKKLSINYFFYFESVINKYKQIMNLDFKNLSVKVMKGKWGVCFPEKSKIVLNTRLIHFPTVALEYVVIHELSHLVHKNHSKDFWRHVERYMPNYKKVSEILKVNVL
ncbi:M48 family metallopeptidase [Spiroplasma cantharicola]|uniref:Zinc metalloprotease n=1 Tax=Spiroplasma cantharicola TaxID=362837 RepID=A0A0M5KLE1_9MOLU|nr:YgjP-like metallopeptidase domain-containing protein [Spiroplasma cantharicola]ALD66089.1 zinc metalloprotease [Spiroplasma cantharicola]